MYPCLVNASTAALIDFKSARSSFKFQEVGVFARFLLQIPDGLLGLFFAPCNNVNFGIVYK